MHKHQLSGSFRRSKNPRVNEQPNIKIALKRPKALGAQQQETIEDTRIF